MHKCLTKRYLCRKQGLTCDEILGELEVDEMDGRQDGTPDIVLFPPEEDEMTDEDSDYEDEDIMEKNPNRLGKGILSQLAELVVHKDEELPDLTVVSNFPSINSVQTLS